MIRTLSPLASPLLCLLVLLAVPLAAGRAQVPHAGAPAAAARPPATTAPAPAITPEQARQALEVLNDPAKRAAITATLQAIARAQPPAQSPAVAPAGPASPAAAAAPPTTSPAAPVAPPGLSLAPDSLGAQVLVGGADVMNRIANRLTEALHAARGLPLLWAWVVTMTTDPFARMLLLDLAWRLAVALAGAFATLWLVNRALRRPLRLVSRRLIRLPPTAVPSGEVPSGETPGDTAPRNVASRDGASRDGASRDGAPEDTASKDTAPEDAAPGDAATAGEAPDRAPGDAAPPADTGEARAERGETEPPQPRRLAAARLLRLARRLPLVLARFALELVPVLGFLLVGHVIAASPLGGSRLVRLILLAVLDSTALCAAALLAARGLLAPRHRRLRLLPLPDATAAYALRWTRRLLLVGVFGYAAAEVGLLLGLSRAAHLVLLKAVALVLHVCIAIIVVQQRRVVRRWIRPQAGATGVLASARNRFAAIWHWIALFYLAALWFVWAAALPAGYGLLWRLLLAFLAVTVLARLATRIGVGALDRLMHAGAELSGEYPGLDGRLSFYQPLLRIAVQAAVLLAGLLVFLQLLGIGAIQWLAASPLGRHVAGSLIVLAITLLLALAAWEAISVAIERHLAHLTRQAQLARIARLRTLLPILRAVLLGAVVTVTALVVLSEIGVNTAPLLASAGIIGVAIGFGSQKLVQDVITGLFLLLENTIQVGDVVRLGGLAGVVEELSVRTIRLRAEDGSVHAIPFSSVGTVTNMTRDYSRAVILASVAYKENYDEVVELLRGIVVEMRADPQWQDLILGDLEVWGLDQFADSAVIIKCRIMCTPFARWSVGREFNRRMKARFDEHGIEIPFPHQKLILDQPLTIHHVSSPPTPEAHPEPRDA